MRLIRSTELARAPHKPAPDPRWLARTAHDRRLKPNRSEARLARTLRSLQIEFEQEVPLDRYIVDFYLPAQGLVIELDGPTHDTKAQQDRDAIRTKRLRRQVGVRVVRISVHHLTQPTFTQYLKQLCQRTHGYWPGFRIRPTAQPSKVLRRRNGVVSAVLSPEALGGRLEGKHTHSPGHPSNRNPAPPETGQVRGTTPPTP